jgi:hypothetical protein
MADLQLLEHLQTERAERERVRYFPRQLLTPDDMVTDQDYIRDKLRRHNRFLHGWGVVCGLEVTPAANGNAPWRIKIGQGYALGPYGDEIYVPEPVYLDLAQCGPEAATDPCEPDRLRSCPGGGKELYIAMKYTECLARPVRAMPAGCTCEEEACEYSRIRDSFQIECLTRLPPSHQPKQGYLLCDFYNRKQLPSCPPCPTDPWVVLAKVTLPADREVIKDIDNFVRRPIFSTAVLQERLIACCCVEKVQPYPFKVNNVRILGGNREFSGEELFNWEDEHDPKKPIQLTKPEFVTIIVEFSEPLDCTAMELGNTFTVMEKGEGNVSNNGKIKCSQNEGTYEWSGSLDVGTFTVTLRGDGEKYIESTNNNRLDGEPHTKLPSGDDKPGGDFTFQIKIPPL